MVDGGDGGAPGPKDGIAVGLFFMLGFGWAKGPDEGEGSVYCDRLGPGPLNSLELKSLSTLGSTLSCHSK